ncbi:MAG: hypothetical protein KDA47_22210, partial [Planctomycetales bacterium]|nr:hypothetical protein [Planctomycetales bacterium]
MSDWFQIDLQGNILRRVEDSDLGMMDSPTGQYSRDRKSKIYERSGDLFLKNLETGKIRQLTRTTARESAPQFMTGDNRIMFRRGDSLLARNLRSDLEEELIDLNASEDPEVERRKAENEYLPKQQLDLFEVLRQRRADSEERRKAAEQARAADKTRTPATWYLGTGREIGQISLSPNGRWCLVVLESKQQTRGKSDKMPEFVDESGYVGIREVRPLVGTGKAISDQLLLLDLKTREKHELDFAGLPMIDSDPLAEVKALAKQWRKNRSNEEAAQQNGSAEQSDASPKSANTEGDQGGAEKNENDQPAPPESSQDESNVTKPNKKDEADRAIQVAQVRWSDNGKHAVVELLSSDNKDRWISAVDVKHAKLDCFMHRRDTAWINYNGCRFVST